MIDPLAVVVFFIAFVIPTAFWLGLLFTLFRGFRTATVEKAASSVGGIVLQCVFASLLVVISFYGLDHQVLGRWLFATAIVPVNVLWLSGLLSRYYSFLSVPLSSAILLSLAAAAAWARLSGKLRLLWPTVLVSVFAITFVIAGKIQFDHDVRSATEKLSPDCLDTGFFVDSPLRTPFSLHAAALKDGDVYGWSFRERDFYKLPRSVVPNVDLPKAHGHTSDYPSCRNRHTLR
jgi:hypothetical protein